MADRENVRSAAYAFIQKHLANCFIFHFQTDESDASPSRITTTGDAVMHQFSALCRSDASRSRRLNVCPWRGGAILWQDGSYAGLQNEHEFASKIQIEPLRVKEKGSNSMKLDADTDGHCFIIYYGNMHHECV